MKLTLAILFTWLVIYCRGRALSLPPSLITSTSAAAMAQRQRMLQHQRQRAASAALTRSAVAAAATIPVRRLRLHELASFYALPYDNDSSNDRNNNNNHNQQQPMADARYALWLQEQQQRQRQAQAQARKRQDTLQRLLIESPYEATIEHTAIATAAAGGGDGVGAGVVDASNDRKNLHDINRYKSNAVTDTANAGVAGGMHQQQQQQLIELPQRLIDVGAGGAGDGAGGAAYDLNIVLPHHNNNNKMNNYNKKNNYNNNNNNNHVATNVGMGMQSRDMLPQEITYNNNNNDNNNNNLNLNDDNHNRNSIVEREQKQQQQLTTELLQPLKYWARHCVPQAATTSSTSSSSSSSSSVPLPFGHAKCRPEQNYHTTQAATAARSGRSYAQAANGDNRGPDGYGAGYGDDDDTAQSADEYDFVDSIDVDDGDSIDDDDDDLDSDGDGDDDRIVDGVARSVDEGVGGIVGAHDGIDALYANLEHLKNYELGKAKPLAIDYRNNNNYNNNHDYNTPPGDAMATATATTTTNNDASLLLRGERDMVKFLYWALEHLYPFHKSPLLNVTLANHPAFQQWKKLNLSGRLEPPLVVEEPHYIIVRREPLPGDLQKDSFYGNDPFIPPRGRKHNLPDLDALLSRYETFVPNRGKRENIKDILRHDDVFFPNRGKKPAPPQPSTSHTPSSSSPSSPLPLSSLSPVEWRAWLAAQLRLSWPLLLLLSSSSPSYSHDGMRGAGVDFVGRPANWPGIWNNLRKFQAQRQKLNNCLQQYAIVGNKFSNRIDERDCASIVGVNNNNNYKHHYYNNNNNINQWLQQQQQQQQQRMSTFKINGHDQSVKLSMPTTNAAVAPPAAVAINDNAAGATRATSTSTTTTIAATNNADAPVTMQQQQHHEQPQAQWLTNNNNNNNNNVHDYDDSDAYNINSNSNSNNNNYYAGRRRRLVAGGYEADAAGVDGIGAVDGGGAVVFTGAGGGGGGGGVGVGDGYAAGAVKANAAANRLHSTRSMSTMAQRQGRQHEQQQQQQQQQQQRLLHKYYHHQLQVPMVLQRRTAAATTQQYAAAAMPRL